MTSYDPLWIYIYEEGLVWFATEKYIENASLDNLANKFIHLTNYSINKDSENFVECEEIKPNGRGSKWCLKSLWWKYIQMNIDYDALFDQIHHLITETLMVF